MVNSSSNKVISEISNPIKTIESKPMNLYPVMIGMILCLVAVEIPYSGVHIPKPLMISLGILSLFVISFTAFENFFLTMLILASFLPFSSILPGDFGGFLTAFNLTNILTLVIVVGWIAKGSFRGQKLYQMTAVDVFLFLFCLLASVSLVRGTIMGSVSDHILFSLKRYLTPFFFFYVFSNNIKTKKEVEYIYVAVAFATFCAAFMALKESYIDIGSFGDWDSMRIGGITKQPNDLAAYFSYYTPFILVPFLYNIKNYRYWVLAFATFCCFWATTRTFSRGGMIAFVVTILITISITHKKTAIVSLIAIIVTVAYFPWLLPESIVGRFRGTYRGISEETLSMSYLPGNELKSSALSSNRLDGSSARRLRIWKDAVPHVIGNPILGIGYGRFGMIMIGDAHNGFILICTEMGIPALLIFLYVLWRMGRAANYLRNFSPHPIIRYSGHAYLCSIIGVVVANQFGSRLNSQELSSLFWIMGGIIMFAEHQMKCEESDEFKTIVIPPKVVSKISGGVVENQSNNYF